MDRLLALIVRFLAHAARLARHLPGWGYSAWQPGQKLRVLLVGYNGSRNTGADARTSCIAAQMEEIFGKDNLELSVMSLDAPHTRRYFGEHVRQVAFNTIFFWPLFKACLRSHVAVLCEGSTFKSTFANGLTLYFCEAAGVMKAQGKPCIAYGSEAGTMDAFVERAVRDLCSETLFLARTENSLDVIRKLGLQGAKGTDTAWTFESAHRDAEAERLLREGGWNGRTPLLGVAPINPFWWPVKASLGRYVRLLATGENTLHFQKWYFFSWSAQRRARYERYLDAIAQAVRSFAREHGYQPVIIGMERLDAQACADLNARLNRPDTDEPTAAAEEGEHGGCPVILSAHHDAFTMAAVLRRLSLLVTSRYHANVLGMAAPVPAVALSMDERLGNIMEEMGLAEKLLLRTDDEQLAEKLPRALRYAYEHAHEVRSRAAHYREQALDTLHRMGGQLRDFVADAYPQLPPPRTKEPRA